MVKFMGKEDEILCKLRYYKLGVRKILELDETEAILIMKPIETVYW